MKKKIISILIAVVLLAGSVAATYFIQQNRYESDIAEVAANVKDLQAQLTVFENENTGNKEILIDMLCRLDYKDKPVYVIGHQTPDSDTVCSAIGMAYLLNSLGISAEARVPDELNLESQFVFSELALSAPELLKDASDKQLWLVDHSASSQMVQGAEKARIVGIIDHHGIGDAETSEPICVLSCPAGSTCSVVYQLCKVCGVELPGDTAGILLAGLLSDTSNMKSSGVTRLDESAFKNLKEISGITDTDGFFNGMLEAKLSYKGMSDTEIFYSDYKDYEHNGTKYGIGCIKVARPDLIPAMAERMQAVIEAEIDGCEADFILYSIYDPDYSTGYMGIAGKDAAFTEKLMSDTFGEKAEKRGDFLIFKPSLSRKTDIVPPIDAYLDTLSSGMKVNSSADDPSGYQISERMRVQIRSLDQANFSGGVFDGVINDADPDGMKEDWEICKLGEWLDTDACYSPFLAATAFGVRNPDWEIEMTDSLLVAPYGRQMLDKPEFPCQPDLYFNLYNNIWGCNQPMWTEGDAQYRFRFLPR